MLAIVHVLGARNIGTFGRGTGRQNDVLCLQPIVADDLTNGYHRALAENPTAIILNMMMPGETGIQMYRSLKRNKALRDIPVIMLATLDKNTFLKCHNLYGHPHCEAYALVDKFMQKPIEAAELLKTVSRCSDHKEGHPGLMSP